MSLKIGKKCKNIPPPIEKGLYSVIFDNTFMGVMIEKKQKFLVIATYNGKGDWIVRTKALLRAEVQWKLGRIANDVYEMMEKKENE